MQPSLFCNVLCNNKILKSRKLRGSAKSENQAPLHLLHTRLYTLFLCIRASLHVPPQNREETTSVLNCIVVHSKSLSLSLYKSVKYRMHSWKKSEIHVTCNYKSYLHRILLFTNYLKLYINP